LSCRWPSCATIKAASSILFASIVLQVAIMCNHQRSVPQAHGAQKEKLTAKLEKLESELEELKKEHKV
jgi:hypothetical protein